MTTRFRAPVYSGEALELRVRDADGAEGHGPRRQSAELQAAGIIACNDRPT